MKKHSQLGQLTSVIAFSLATGLLFANPSFATGTITRSDLSGPWQITLTGNTGCGLSSMLVNVTLNTLGVGTGAVIKTHGQCGNSIIGGQTFKILTMLANGRGTANLSCGAGCGWNFDIQVSADRSIFNIVDVDPLNPNNFIGGMAVHQ